jgi:hypothetical protein
MWVPIMIEVAVTVLLFDVHIVIQVVETVKIWLVL